MGRLWSSGFELNLIGTEFDFSSGGISIVTSPVRSGTYAGKCILGGAAAYFGHQFHATSGNGPYYFRAYVKIGTLPSAETDLMWLQQSSGSFFHCASINITTTGALRLYNYDGSGNKTQVGSDSTVILNTTQWYRLEMKFDRTPAGGSQILEAKIDGVVFATASNLTISNQPGQLAVGGNGALQTATGTWYFDDIAFNDTTGASQNSYPGAGKIIHIHPNADGDAHNWLDYNSGGAGTSTNYTKVNEIAPDDATNAVKRNLLNSQDMYKCGPSGIPANSVVNLVAVGARFVGLGTVNAPFKLQIEKVSAGTISQSPTITPANTSWITNAVTPSNYQLTLYSDPDSNPWTQATLDTMQIGQICTAASTSSSGITCIWALIEYNPVVSKINTTAWNDLLKFDAVSLSSIKKVLGVSL